MSFQPLSIKHCCFLLFVWADCFTILGLVLGRRVSQAALPPWKGGGGGGGGGERAFFKGVRGVEDSVLIKSLTTRYIQRDEASLKTEDFTP